MKTMRYYLDLYGNTSFSDYALNDVDGIVFSQLAYLNFDSYIDVNESLKFKEIIKPEYFEALAYETVTTKQDIRLLKKLANTTRYNNIVITDVKNIFDRLLCVQFFAMTLLIDDFAYVVFRGTDPTLVGWKEDFNMSYLEQVPAQKYSLEYLNFIHEKYKCKLCVAGHSKGGNLAVYSVLNSSKELQEDIIFVKNYDGPGFTNNIYADEDYQSLKERIDTYTTQEAMIGVLLNHVDNLLFVKSSGVGFFQHNLHNWRVDKKGNIKKVKRNSPTSRVFARTIRHFFEETNELERKQFVDLSFKVLEVYPNATLNDFKRRPFNFIWRMRRKYKFLTKEEKKFLSRTFKKFRKAFYKSFKSKITEKLYKKR